MQASPKVSIVAYVCRHLGILVLSDLQTDLEGLLVFYQKGVLSVFVSRVLCMRDTKTGRTPSWTIRSIRHPASLKGSSSLSFSPPYHLVCWYLSRRECLTNFFLQSQLSSCRRDLLLLPTGGKGETTAFGLSLQALQDICPLGRSIDR